MDPSERSGSAHEGEVVGIACDSTNTHMISAGYHGDIKVSVYFFHTLCSTLLLDLLVDRHFAQEYGGKLSKD